VRSLGGAGTNGQHAFYQLIHQGTKLIPADFIGFAQSTHESGEQQDLLMSNCIAQSKVLAFGRTAEEVAAEGTDPALVPHSDAGKPPSSTSSPRSSPPRSSASWSPLRAHRVHRGSGVGIDSFDQWGVELGKVMAKQLAPALTSPTPPDLSDQDSSTSTLVRRYRGCVTVRSEVRRTGQAELSALHRDR